jgi:hypothetical protein
MKKKTDNKLEKETGKNQDKNDDNNVDSDKHHEAKIPRNLNYYRHLLEANYINENDINWVLKLRDSKKYKSEKLITFIKKTERRPLPSL